MRRESRELTRILKVESVSAGEGGTGAWMRLWLAKAVSPLPPAVAGHRSPKSRWVGRAFDNTERWVNPVNGDRIKVNQTKSGHFFLESRDQSSRTRTRTRRKGQPAINDQRYTNKNQLKKIDAGKCFFCKMLAWHVMGSFWAGFCPNLDRTGGGGEVINDWNATKNGLLFTFRGRAVWLFRYGGGGVGIADFTEILTG